ncbi:4-hydroxy-tetrahydrodipicolinate synthase [Catelliglobosispora koreensis]|uniref:4-hydroxy-tetrahydrodipicolinate synthase n=1 Tax=Catelliglobosispora koreensis TaxID=129052 RepID=UPI000367A699|nr:4-hydroxy-tetrahydrodipicolinate synthase [Catelliglobosispora koreensis]
MTQDVRRPFGRVITAMVTPMHADHSIDVDGVSRLAEYLVDEQGNDALVINGTAGEASTTSDSEKETILRAVVEAVGGRAKILAGVGTNNTAHTIELARQAEKAGVHGLLVVTPYYNKPPQSGLLKHFTTVADSTGLPMLVYDIPHRSGIPIATETMLRLAEHERIVGVKDAKVDLVAQGTVLRRHPDFAYYSGEDAATLPVLAVGGVGVVGTSTHLNGNETKAMIEAFDSGDHSAALQLHLRLLPLFTGIFRTQGTILVKAAMNVRGLPGGPVRLPLADATEAELAQLRSDCADAGVPL